MLLELGSGTVCPPPGPDNAIGTSIVTLPACAKRSVSGIVVPGHSSWLKLRIVSTPLASGVPKETREFGGITTNRLACAGGAVDVDGEGCGVRDRVRVAELLPLAVGEADVDGRCLVGLALDVGLVLGVTLGLELGAVDGLSTGPAAATDLNVPQSDIAGELIDTSASGLLPSLIRTTFTVVLSPLE
jgi:hypothetical protein